MDNQSILLVIGIAVLVAAMFVMGQKENYASVPYSFQDETGQASFTSSAPAEEDTDPTSCRPADGNWMKEAPMGSPIKYRLDSPCCQPPDYKLYDSDYKTCKNWSSESEPKLRKCLETCCSLVDKTPVQDPSSGEVTPGAYDTSWLPMARCGCALWCYNQNVPHFQKHTSGYAYVTADQAAANTPDGTDFIQGSGQ